MPMQPGTRLGPYEVLAPIGAGGMGEVCRARDTKLNREVAIKVLPTAFAAEPDRMARFHREAQLLATLNHPHIAAIYGFEEGPPEGGPYMNAIVMELVEGPTLAELIERGPLPQDEALQIARQIAEALEYAHDRGVVHRDLKPANIKVTPDGAVKVLDFGLAKALGNDLDSSLASGNSMSPTLSLAATYAGVILGTAAYMAPEQAKGKGVDRRADIWAFGVVLYEMLTGRRMFAGDSVAETLASVMKDPIAFAAIPAEAPAAVRRLVSRCLERDARRRLQWIGEARIVIEDVIGGTAADNVPTQPAAPPVASRLPWVIAAVALLAAIAVGGWAWSRPEAPRPAVTRFVLVMPPNVRLTSSSPNAPQVAVSPDGRLVVFAADETGRDRTLWVRAFDSLVARRIERTEGAMFPFWSPDSRHVAYFLRGRLMRVSIAGGAPLVVSDYGTGDGEGGAWFQPEGEDGFIVFAPAVRGPLRRAPASGGESEPFTALAEGEESHSFPQFLPDGALLYLAEGRKTSVFVRKPGSATPTFIADVPGRAMFAPPGYLLYMRDNTLLAHQWNLDTLQLEGEPVSVADGVRTATANGRNAYSTSSNGVLVYRGGGQIDNQRVQWYTRDGKPDGLVLEPGDYGQLELAPDGSKFVIVRGSADGRDLWVKDLVSGVFSRLTGAGAEVDPVWAPDSRSVAYASLAPKGQTLHETVLGTGKHTALATIANAFPADWTANGNNLLLTASGTLRLFPMRPASAASAVASAPVLEEKYETDQFRVSPDGEWVAFMSQESGQPQITVAAFPSFTKRRQVSNARTGAVQPLWRGDGKELFFFDRGGTITAVDVRTAPGMLETGPARALFSAPTLNPSFGVHFYAVTADGKRFLMREAAVLIGEEEPLYVVTNWTSLLAQ